MDPLAALASLHADHGDAIPLDVGAALLAKHEDPDVDVGGVLASLDELASSVRLAPETSGFEAVARLNHRLFDELGFAGDAEDYDDPLNSRIDAALERRKGLPITLSVIYVEVARRKGVVVDPIGFPSHFLVSPRTEPRFFVDPFAGGRIVREDALGARLEAMNLGADPTRWLRPATGKDVLVRMAYNLLGSYRRRADVEGVTRALAWLRALGAA